MGGYFIMIRKRIFLVVMMLSMLFIFTCSIIYASENLDKKLKVAFLYETTVGDYGWFYSHNVARIKADNALDFIETRPMENVTPGAVGERIIKELCNDGIDVIVAAGMQFQADVVKVAKDYPNVKFLICSGTVSTNNIESFWPDRTQLWYMLGQIAGLLTKTNYIGTVGSFSTPLGKPIENAWLLGAQSVNPEVKERIIFVNTWYDPAAERDAALSLIDAGVDVLSQNTNSPAVVQAAEEMGVYAMAQFEDMREFGPNAYIGGEILKWGNYYIQTFTSIYEGTWEAKMYYPDFPTGVIDLQEFGPMVTEQMKEIVNSTKRKILDEDPYFFWEGPIYDNQGNLRVKKGEKKSLKEYSMDWSVKGIISSSR